MNKQQPQKKELAYYINIFKLEGHATFRASFTAKPNDFALEKAQDKNFKPLDMKVYRIDRLTGELAEHV